MAYSKRSLTSCSDSGLLGFINADLTHVRRSAMLTVAEVKRAAALCGTDLKISTRASEHLLKGVDSSMACSTYEVLAQACLIH